MKTLIKNAVILQKESEYHLQARDILIENGEIRQIAKSINGEGAMVISGKKLYCCPGLFDIGTHSGEPGYEHRETFRSLGAAARAGGYTGLAIFPNNKPVTQTRGDIQLIMSSAKAAGVSLYAIGVLSKNLAGQDLAEFLDMAEAGAVGFSDGLLPVNDGGLLNRALLYARQTGKPVLHHPDDKYLSGGGEMHEGHVSTSMGLKGVPAMAERAMVYRDVLLCEYNNAPLIVHAVSAKESLSVIGEAKAAGLPVSATVAYNNLVFTDADLSDFDTNLKVMPVIRSEEHRAALAKGLLDGTIDAIISNHVPLDEESKNLEFPYANPGAIGLETCLAACITHLSDKVPLDVLTEKLSSAPRRLLGLPVPVISESNPADLCVFDAEEESTFGIENLKSISANNPYIGRRLRGKVVFTAVKGH